jgi:hypothetical protein
VDESENRDQFRTQRDEENPTTRVRELRTKNSPAEKQLQNGHAQGRAQFGAKKGPFGAANAQISAHRGRTLQVRRRNAKNTPRKTEMSLGTATVGSAAPSCPFWAPQRLQEVISGRATTGSGRAAHPLRNRRCSGTVYRRMTASLDASPIRIHFLGRRGGCPGRQLHSRNGPFSESMLRGRILGNPIKPHPPRPGYTVECLLEMLREQTQKATKLNTTNSIPSDILRRAKK